MGRVGAHAYQQAVDALLSAFQRQDLSLAKRLAIDLTLGYADDAFAWKALGTVLSELAETQDAYQALTRAVTLDPDDAQTQLNLGNLLAQMGQVDEALRAMARAIELQPHEKNAHAAQANLLGQLGQHEAAKRAATQALGLGEDARVHGVMANACLALGDLAAALAHVEQGLHLEPHMSALWVILGQVRRAQQDPNAALQALLRAMEISPNSVVVRLEAARVLMDLQQLDQACELLVQTLGLEPGHADVSLALSDALISAGSPVQALGVLDEALVHAPRDARLLNARGLALEAGGDLGSSIAAYEQAIDAEPEHAPAHNNLALALVKSGRYIDGLAHARTAVAQAPEHAEMWSNLGHLLQDLGDLNESLDCYRRSLAIAPDHHAVRSNLLFGLNYQGDVSERAAFDEALAYGARVTAQAALAPIHRQGNRLRAMACGKLRVGFVSGDMRDHPVGYFGAPVLCALAQQGVEVLVYANHRQEDAITRQVQQAVSRYVYIDQLNDRQAAQLIADDDLDVLVDLSGHTAYNRLPVFAYRPAPLQVAWLGYFATTGVAAMDYIVCDEFVLPKANECWFTEKPLRVTPSYLCYTPPAEPAPIDAGDRVRPFTFACFNNPSKLNDAVIALWSRVLLDAPEARLLLMAKPYRDPAVRAHMRRRFEAHGVADEAIALESAVDRAHYFAAHNQVDLLLDPFPYPGGTTSADAWWMGVPVLSLAGSRFVSRNALTLGRNMGEAFWWAEDEVTYRALALQRHQMGCLPLSERLTRRTKLRASTMLDSAAFALALEKQLVNLVQHK